MPTPDLPADQPVTVRVVPMPADTNSMGDIFGGWIMSQVDIAGGIAAARLRWLSMRWSSKSRYSLAMS
jgi:acyl-CoA hydrolase